ncbi:MAG: hypothetical protein WKG07_19180 [Hymenobacter sp.]
MLALKAQRGGHPAATGVGRWGVFRWAGRWWRCSAQVSETPESQF